jgi:hypothetical protein
MGVVIFLRPAKEIALKDLEKLHKTLIQLKIIAVELASWIVFIWWILRALWHELR